MAGAMERSLFRHRTQVRVRNYEVDWQGIVHNALYLQYFEVGRIEYLRNLGLKLELGSTGADVRVVLVRNEVNYKSPARFDELLNVYSRISYIRNTSFAFEGLLEDAAGSRLIAENIAIHVWLHPRTDEPITVGSVFRKAVADFEGENLATLGPTPPT
jgi:acyl-CoA thioester hydrolase